MSRNIDLSSIITNFGRKGINPLEFDFENQLTITSNTTFVVPPNTKAIKFMAVGGGQPGTAGTFTSNPLSGIGTGGPGGGYFEKTFYAPFVGLTTSFQLTVGAIGGNTVLANSAGTTIATAFGATAVGVGATVGVGGTASGGDINANGSPGGRSPGVGGASGGMYGSGQYNSTYAGRWVYLSESITNDGTKNHIISNYFLSGGGSIEAVGIGTAGVAPIGAGGAGGAGKLYVSGGAGGSGVGADGGAGGPGGFGAAGGAGGPGGPSSSTGGTGGAGGPGGFGGGGGAGAPTSVSPSVNAGSGGNGAPGGFGGGGGAGGGRHPTGASTNGAGGLGGPGAIIVQWTTSLPNKVGGA